jgi:hypothetical protein
MILTLILQIFYKYTFCISYAGLKSSCFQAEWNQRCKNCDCNIAYIDLRPLSLCERRRHLAGDNTDDPEIRLCVYLSIMWKAVT